MFLAGMVWARAPLEDCRSPNVLQYHSMSYSERLYIVVSLGGQLDLDHAVIFLVLLQLLVIPRKLPDEGKHVTVCKCRAFVDKNAMQRASFSRTALTQGQERSKLNRTCVVSLALKPESSHEGCFFPCVDGC